MIKGIGHIAFNISNLERSLDFYCHKLGLREAFRLDREGTPSPWIVYLQIAPGHFIELFPGATGENKSSQVGYNHFCLLVEDMATTLKELEARGLPISGEPTRGLDNNWQYWLTDPDGNRIELMQIAPNSPHAAADNSWTTSARP
ncbi:VOC family protein [Ktedonobacter robiniae]|uniref:Lactoylglutathione lyase n=1 Tax=Ktedonobacter robiniae TaxID=2778365 RepID=A0ABQ3V0H4_9CHLR|nr:VOC family protein [Ktedonobacter robiniae]GHO58107.1 lactoylglutathione lyase [Ktedonobacter robiniae]